MNTVNFLEDTGYPIENMKVSLSNGEQVLLHIIKANGWILSFYELDNGMQNIHTQPEKDFNETSTYKHPEFRIHSNIQDAFNRISHPYEKPFHIKGLTNFSMF